jgi:transposase
MSEREVQKRYTEEFKRQAVELTQHSGRSIVQIGRELGVSEATLHIWRKAYGAAAGLSNGGGPGEASVEELRAENRRLHKEIEALKRQREILSLVLSNAPFASTAAGCSP